jgi:hypothetical protein
MRWRRPILEPRNLPFLSRSWMVASLRSLSDIACATEMVIGVSARNSLVPILWTGFPEPRAGLLEPLSPQTRSQTKMVTLAGIARDQRGTKPPKPLKKLATTP